MTGTMKSCNTKTAYQVVVVMEKGVMEKALRWAVLLMGVQCLAWSIMSATATVVHGGTPQLVSDSAAPQKHSLLRPQRGGDGMMSAPSGAVKAPSAKEVSKKKSLKKSPQSPAKMATSEGMMSSISGGTAQIESPVGTGDASGGVPARADSSKNSGMASTSSTMPSVPASTGSMSTVRSGLVGAAAPVAAPTMGTDNSGVVGSPPPQATSKNVQRLLRELPGLSGVLTAPRPPVPPDTIAAPAPPLGPPPSGLPVPPANWFGYHVLNRVTYGGTANQLNAVSHMNAAQADAWANRFMKEQLGLDPNLPWPTNLHSTSPLPSAIPIIDSDTDVLLAQDKADWRVHEDDASLLVPDLSQLQDHDLIRKMLSRRQLLEKMVYFWDNHFNTDYRSHFSGQYEIYENETFRSLALGKFVDLLTASGKSSAMMVYLNTDVNVKESPNENYAREVLELHTLGVDDLGRPAGYTQTDIVEAAKTLTGWDTPSGPRPGFRFVSSRHSSGSKQVLGQTISFDGVGPGEGERLLQIAAAHPSTARHIAKKLCEYFVSETPSPALITEVASVFVDSGGDIKKVLIAIFTSPDFRNVASYRSLVKTPLEFVVGLHRNLGVWSSRDPFRSRLTRSGQGLYEMPPPTGYKEKSDHWLSTHVLFNEAGMAYEATIPGFGSTIRYGSDTTGGLTRVWLRNLGLRTEEEILGFLLNLTTDRQVTATEYQIYLTTLRSAGGTFSLDNSNVEGPLDRTLASILANPRYLYQ